MSRAWEQGRLARIAGKPRAANPHLPGKRSRSWLSGWLHSDARCIQTAQLDRRFLRGATWMGGHDDTRNLTEEETGR